MRYEERLAEIEGDPAKTDALVAECARLRAKLEAETLAAGDCMLYEQLIELIIRVNVPFLAAHESLRQEVKGAMGGDVWELLGERAERLEREAREALEQGLEQGRSEAVDAMAEQLRAQGIDASEIDKAVAAVRSATEKQVEQAERSRSRSMPCSEFQAAVNSCRKPRAAVSPSAKARDVLQVTRN